MPVDVDIDVDVDVGGGEILAPGLIPVYLIMFCQTICFRDAQDLMAKLFFC